jgi:cytochrome c5
MAVLAVVASVWVFALPPGTTEEISQRIDPFGSVSRVGDAGGAPTFGDTAQWAERVDQGMDVLMDHTINGIRTMPAKGTCMNCSDDELNAAVTYILDNLP